jgi:hypothetical protein
VEGVVARVVVFGDDFVQRSISTGLHLLDIVGFLSDEPHGDLQMDWSTLEESAGVASTGLPVGSVEFVLGVNPVVLGGDR